MEKQTIQTKGEEAVEIFKLAKSRGALPQKIEDLVPLSFIGQAAVTFYRATIKAMDQMKTMEAQRKATLKDGQEAGEMLLDIETRIGEAAYQEEQSRPEMVPRAGSRPTKDLKKHEKIGIPHHRMKQAQAISKHPEVVERVKAQAKANEDIPTRTAVINEIRYQKEKERRQEAEKKHSESKGIISIDQTLYISALDRCLNILPKDPPKKWNDQALKEATGKAKIIIKRLEVFNG